MLACEQALWVYVVIPSLHPLTHLPGVEDHSSYTTQLNATLLYRHLAYFQSCWKNFEFSPLVLPFLLNYLNSSSVLRWNEFSQ